MVFDFANPSASLRIATVVMPVGLYFLILGLLNSRRHPQLLRARRDFALLIVALCPLLAMPLLFWVQETYFAAAAMVAAGCGVALLAPRGPSWVIYNIAPPQAVEAVAAALQAAGVDFRQAGRRFHLGAGGAVVEVAAFPLLRNVSIRMTGSRPGEPARFEAALASRLRTIDAETTPTAMALLLVAAGMLVAPLALVAPQAGQIVRILTGMLY